MSRPRYCRAGSVLWRRIGADVLVLPPGSAQPLVLGDEAARVWDALVEPVEEDRLKTALCYNDLTSSEQSAAQLAIAALVMAGLVQEVT